jgi:hypothetical protein
MNRREAMAALMALPQVTRVARTWVAPTDVIVVECDQRLTPEAVSQLRARVRDVWPGQTVLICDAGLRIKVLES